MRVDKPTSREASMRLIEAACEYLNATDPEAVSSILVSLQAMRARQNTTGACSRCGQTFDLTADGLLPIHRRQLSPTIEARVVCDGALLIQRRTAA